MSFRLRADNQSNVSQDGQLVVFEQGNAMLKKEPGKMR
jgi:hypothetical protein